MHRPLPKDALPSDKRLSSELELLARVMDSAVRVPGSRIRLGLDALLGLAPGVGDVISSVVSLYLLQAARRLGVSRLTQMRMVVNIAIDVLFGAVPLAGDVFDVFWKTNEKNLQLLRRHVTSTDTGTARKAHWSDALFLAAVAGALLAMIIGSLMIAWWLVAAVVRLF